MTTLPMRALVARLGLVALAACASGSAGRTPPVPPRSAGGATAVRDPEARTLENLFAGRFPGVTVARAQGGGLQLRIRGGTNSLQGSGEPLYVVDGLPLAAGMGEIGFLNPHDVARIEVLTDAADLALYGVRGANGIIRITTKRAGGR
jgi:TonB-dependent SusC/RagA subfamily outer membrane receptor